MRISNVRRIPMKRVMQRVVVSRRGKRMVYLRDTGKRSLFSVRAKKSPRVMRSFSLFDLAA